MTSPSRNGAHIKHLKGESGQALLTVLIAVVLLSIIGYTMSTQYVGTIRSAYFEIERDLYKSNVRSGIETFTVLYRMTNLRYSEFVASCDQARDFTRALNEGHGCASVGTYTAFSAADIADLDPAADLNVTFLGSCEISATASTCSTDNAIYRLQYKAMRYEFFFNGLISTKNQAEFTMRLSSARYPQVLTQRFALQSTLPSLTHVESSNGNVVAESPSNFSSCGFEAWQPVRAGSPCQTYGELGGGIGLAYYKERFFGLRSFDGQIVDLGGLSTTTFEVAENGTMGGVSVFPEYCKADLVNADDLTVISNGDRDELFIVTGEGTTASIVYVQKASGACSRHVVCDLSAAGWGQAYSGLASDPMSNMMAPPAEFGSLPFTSAVFFLKTDTGKTLTAHVSSREGNISGPNSVYDTALNRTFRCSINYDQQKQVDERSRTLGFERGGAQPQSYFVY